MDRVDADCRRRHAGGRAGRAFAYSTLTATTPIVVSGGPTSIAGPRWIVAAAQVVAALALVRRRRAPFATLVTVVVVLAVPTLAFGGSEGLGSFAALAVALYSAGAHCERRQAVIGLVVLTGFWALLVVRDPLNEDIRDMLGSWPVFLVYVLVWLLGVYLRTRRLYVAQLRERAEHAERDREERGRAATADERARIARELHDAVAHAMSVIVVQAEAADEMLALGARSEPACRSSGSASRARGPRRDATTARRAAARHLSPRSRRCPAFPRFGRSPTT